MTSYPKLPDYSGLINQLHEYARLKHEYGAVGVEKALEAVREMLSLTVKALQNWPEDEALRLKEPDAFTDILRLRQEGPRRLWKTIDETVYEDKLAGAFLARSAGCSLGAPVEGWSVAEMRDWAAYTGDTFPPVDYWSKVPFPYRPRYSCTCGSFTRDGMNGVPADDDLAYTLLGLLIAEQYGSDFTVADVGKAWLDYLPYACTAEDIALKNLKAGINPSYAADSNNPYCQWIGADIRSDPWAYIAPGWPEKAAAMAYNDAYISHRRNGIYGEMFFAAAQSAAFAVNDPMEAIAIGLTEIPAECTLYEDIAWALDKAPSIKDYKAARAAVDERFTVMSGVHTNNNACLTVFGLGIGGCDVTKVLSETVAMGLDNDCTAATAGSIVGAVVGKNGVPGHWHAAFNNRIDTYLIGHESFAIDDVLSRYAVQARRVFGIAK